MSTFNDREAAFEAKFAHDEEMTFKAFARRDHLLGLWAAEKLGKTGTDAEAYAQALVKEDFADPRHETIASHISKDLGDLANEDDVKAKMAEFLSAAKEQLAEEA